MKNIIIIKITTYYERFLQTLQNSITNIATNIYIQGFLSTPAREVDIMLLIHLWGVTLMHCMTFDLFPLLR